MAREQDGQARVAQVGDDRADRDARLRIHARRRLVEDDDLGPADEREREPETLAFAAGQPAIARVGHGPQPDQVEQLVRVARVGVESAVLPERLARPGPRVDAAVLEHEPDACPQRRTAGRRIQPEDAWSVRRRRGDSPR